MLISSADPDTASSFTSLLADRAEVSSVSSFRELVLILEAEAEAKLVLVVDCQKPALRATAVAALADELSARVTVILWRSAPATYQAVLATSPGAQRFVACAESAGTEAVVERCRKIVG